MKKPKLLLKKTYLGLIKNSIGTRMFRSFYARTDKGMEDLLNDGELSCAYFVSSILKLFDWIDKPHLTIDSTETELMKNGWKKIPIDKIKEGSIIIWEEINIGGKYNRHIGFYIGNNKAVSASYKLKRVVSHDLTFGGKRKVESVYWKKLN